MRAVSFICCSRNPERAERLLLRTCAPGDDVHVVKAHSMAAGYAEAEKKARHDIRVFVHDDVRFPSDFRERLHKEVIRVHEKDRSWALIGVSGASWDWNGDELRGITQYAIGDAPIPAIVDEVDSVLVVKRSDSPKFDPRVPTFHGAVEDVCMAAARDNRQVWVLNLGIRHLSSDAAPKKLDAELQKAAKYLVRKWKSDIPSSTRIWEHSLALLNGRSVDYVCAGLNAALNQGG